ncbi:uncharacterized protein EV154DRAFT_426534, partial [Mucor mucedo]|uniref:uncharacterized protein n=1 Tax=Mucor mucedo TaxID=29922 RepID=UPI00221EFA66
MTQLETQQHDLLNQVHTINQSNKTAPISIKIRLPSPFSGQSASCNTFFTQLSLYFAGNPGYDNDAKKILLATSCLTGPAYAYIEPYLRKLDALPHNKPDVLTSYQVFVDTITAAFGDSDPTMSAELALRRLRQTNSATAYATEIRR